MILTEKELEHVWGGGPLREAAGLNSSETGRPPNYQTNGTCPPLSTCAKHNYSSLHRSRGSRVPTIGRGTTTIIFTISFLQSNETWPFSLPTIRYRLVSATHCGVVALV